VIVIGEPLLGELEEKLVLEVLRSGRLVEGAMVEAFEEAVHQTVGTRHAVAVNNGTSALIASLLAHGIGPGDEVITSPFTFVATLNAILHVGAVPRFVDIGDDFNLDPAALGDAMGPATRAVVPVHLYGYPADMSCIEAAAAHRNVAVIEDASQALGSSQSGRPVGSFGTGCFSFYATKNVTTGEGGVVTTDDDGIAAAVRSLRNQGQRARYVYERVGFNFRMTELQAALGVAQMTRLPGIVEARRENARALMAGLAGIQGLVTPTEGAGRRHVFHQFTVRLTTEARVTRSELLRHLRGRGIQCAVYYPRPVFDYYCFRSDPRVGNPAAPTAHRVAGEVLSLPVHPKLTERDLARIVEAVREALEH
jgi:dTDP-4-amino-4,6-dideoxygalactose transaminase